MAGFATQARPGRAGRSPRRGRHHHRGARRSPARVHHRQRERRRLDHSGQGSHVELDALPGKSYGGIVVRVAPTFDPVTRTLDAEVQLANDAGELRPGMYGRAAVRLEVHPRAPVVPVNALQITENQKYVFVLNDTKVSRRSVRLGTDVGDSQSSKSRKA